MMQIASFCKRNALALALGVALMASTAMTAQAAPPSQRADKTVIVQFAKGATERSYKSSVRGYQVHAYRFRASKGQVLNVDLASNSTGVDTVVNYLGRQPTDSLGTTDQVLPYTGEYEVRVLQTRNAARTNTKANRPYTMTITISGAVGSRTPDSTAAVGGNTTIVDAPWLRYRCDGGKVVSARYHFGEAVGTAEVETGNRTLGMRYGAGSSSESNVYHGDGYTWSVDNAGPNKAGMKDGFLFKNTTSVVNGKKMPVAEIVARNCSVVR